MENLIEGKSFDFSALCGATITGIKKDGEQLLFYTNIGVFKMWHDQDCCEIVTLADVCGDLSDLIGTPVVYALESSSQRRDEDGLQGWTFYNIGTQKGHVTLRWDGEFLPHQTTPK